MLHKTLEAKATVTDLGEFEAIAAAYTVDRIKDQIVRGAFAKTIAAWQESGKQIPLHWDHSGAAEDIIGSVDPGSMVETDEGLRVKGKVDLGDSEVAKEAWRSMKNNAVALSFGYIPTKTKQRKADGVLELHEIDLFEISVVPAPMNPDTRFLNLKSAKDLASEVRERLDTAAAERFGAADDRYVYVDDFDPDAKWAVFCVAGRGDPPRYVKVGYSAAADGEITLAEGEADVQRVTEYQPKSAGEAVLRRQSGQVDRELKVGALNPDATLEERLKHAQDAMLAAELFDPGEIDGLKAGRLKAVWSAAYINDLPDSAFLYVEPGGDKDDEGKTTPRSLRHFPYKDASGNVDLPHLRNALSRIPQSSLSQDVKDRLAARAQRILDSEKSVARTDKEPDRVRSVDPLRKRSQEAVLDIRSGGLSQRPSPTQKAEPPPEPPAEAELRRRSRDVMLELLTGVPDDTERA